MVDGDGAGIEVNGLRLATGSGGSEVRGLEVREWLGTASASSPRTTRSAPTSFARTARGSSSPARGRPATSSAPTPGPATFSSSNFDLGNVVVDSDGDGIEIVDGATGTKVVGQLRRHGSRRQRPSSATASSGIDVENSSGNQLGPGNRVTDNGDRHGIHIDERLAEPHRRELHLRQPRARDRPRRGGERRPQLADARLGDARRGDDHRGGLDHRRSRRQLLRRVLRERRLRSLGGRRGRVIRHLRVGDRLRRNRVLQPDACGGLEVDDVVTATLTGCGHEQHLRVLELRDGRRGRAAAGGPGAGRGHGDGRQPGGRDARPLPRLRLGQAEAGHRGRPPTGFRRPDDGELVDELRLDARAGELLAARRRDGRVHAIRLHGDRDGDGQQRPERRSSRRSRTCARA